MLSVYVMTSKAYTFTHEQIHCFGDVLLWPVQLLLQLMDKNKALKRRRLSSRHGRHAASDTTFKGQGMDDRRTSGVDARACRQVSARGHGGRRRRHAISHVNKLRHQ